MNQWEKFGWGVLASFLGLVSFAGLSWAARGLYGRLSIGKEAS